MNWLNDPAYNSIVVIIVILWMSMGAGFLAFVAGLQQLNPSLAEAGEPPLLEGTAVGIDDAGRLCVRGAADNSITAVSAGEVSVRGLYGYS